MADHSSFTVAEILEYHKVGDGYEFAYETDYQALIAERGAYVREMEEALRLRNAAYAERDKLAEALRNLLADVTAASDCWHDDSSVAKARKVLTVCKGNEVNNTLRRWLWQLHLIPEAPRYKENETLLEALDRHIKEIEDIAMYNQMSSGGYMNLELLKRCRSALRSCGLSGGDNG